MKAAALAPPITELSTYPPLMSVREVAEVLRLHYKTVLAAVAASDTARVPLPALIRPYRWRRSDVALWIDRATLAEQRRGRLSLRARRDDL